MPDPNAEVLAAHALGELAPDRAADVEAALAGSPTLRRRMDRVREALDLLRGTELAEPPVDLVRRAVALGAPSAGSNPVSAWLDRAADFVARLVFDSRTGGALAGFRGTGMAQPRHLTFECEIAEVDVEVLAAGDGRFRLRGQVAPTVPRGPVEVGLTGAGGRTAAITVMTDAQGHFEVTITEGDWEMRVAMDAKVVALPALTIG
jgi:anti-sigma factor RsiW